jgi:hypothetical protein
VLVAELAVLAATEALVDAEAEAAALEVAVLSCFW